MHSRLRLITILGLLLVLILACVQSSSSFPNDGNGAAEPGDEEPVDSAPTDLPLPTASPAQTLLPPTGGGEPSPTPVAISMDLNSVYARVVEELPKGAALFNPPATMRVGEMRLVEVRVVPMTGEEIEQDEQLRATLTSDLDDVDEVIVIPLRVSTVMSARLSGAAFEIDPLQEEEQIRTIDDLYLSWMWEVTPQESGDQRLTLFLSVVVNAEGLGDKTHTTSEVRTVQVQSNPIYSVQKFFGTNWEWVATGLLFPALGWAWRRFRRRSNR